MLITLFATIPSSRLRTAIISSELLCKINHFILTMQAFNPLKNTYMNLYELK